MSRTLRALACCALLLTPTLVLAHSPIKDIGNFYGGLLHPLFIPAHALLLGALGLLLGQQEPVENLWPLLLFLCATVAGLAVAGFSDSAGFETVQLLGTAVIGLLVAINPALPLLVRIAAGGFAGFAVAADSGQAELAGAALFASLVGTALGMSVLLLCLMGFADYFKDRHWQKIGIRVIGSWITACALLVLSLSFASRTAT